MSGDLEIRCACGTLRGTLRNVSPRRGNRLVCYCDDCQSFAYFLGHAERVLDAHGGTDIFQTSPARLELGEGVERLACVRLRPRGLLRWYASCCRTPIGNTPASAKLPFLGLIHTCIGSAPDGRPADAVLGPVRARIHARFAKGDPSALGAHAGVPLRLALPLARILLGARLRGDARRSPFFDATRAAPRVAPEVLDADRLRALETARDSA